MSVDKWVVIVGNFATGVEAVIGPFATTEEAWFPPLKNVLLKKIEYYADADRSSAWTEHSRVDVQFDQDHKIKSVLRGYDKPDHTRRWGDDLYYVISKEDYIGQA